MKKTLILGVAGLAILVIGLFAGAIGSRIFQQRALGGNFLRQGIMTAVGLNSNTLPNGQVPARGAQQGNQMQFQGRRMMGQQNESGRQFQFQGWQMMGQQNGVGQQNRQANQNGVNAPRFNQADCPMMDQQDISVENQNQGWGWGRNQNSTPRGNAASCPMLNSQNGQGTGSNGIAPACQNWAPPTSSVPVDTIPTNPPLSR